MTENDPIDYDRLARKVASNDELSDKLASKLDTGSYGDKVMLSRRQLAAIAGSGLGAGALGALGIGDAEASTPGSGDGESGVLGTSSDKVDGFFQDIDVSQEATVQDLTVNGSATGFSSGILLESTDSITLHDLEQKNSAQNTFITLFSGSSATVLGGTVHADGDIDFLYTFSDGNTIRRNGTGTSYSRGVDDRGASRSGDLFATCYLPPAKNVDSVDVGHNISNSSSLGAVLYTI
jgi:hypothetical protein